MSKYIGNVLDPMYLINQFGVDKTRFYLIAGLATLSNSGFISEKLELMFEKHFKNGLGNIAKRLFTLSNKSGLTLVNDRDDSRFLYEALPIIAEANIQFGSYEFNKGFAELAKCFDLMNTEFQTRKPWLLSADEQKPIFDFIYTTLCALVPYYKSACPDIGGKFEDMLLKQEVGFLV
jgi:methionyl-tRNA synthetase